MLTGWTLEYIDSLGLIDQMAILEIYEAKQKLMAVQIGGNSR